MIDLRAIHVFLAVSESESFTMAAKRLDITQSAVSQTIRQLEDQFGVVLINRTSRSFALTPAGSLLRERGRQVLDDATALADLVREQAGSKLNELRIGMVDSFAIAVGPVLIQSLLGHAFNLSLWSDLTPRLGDALVRGKVDLIVANDAFEDFDSLVRFELLREPYILLLPKVAALEPKDLVLGNLARSYPMIRFHPASFMGTQIERQFHLLNITPSRRVSVDSTDKLIAMVAAGIGWAISTPLALLRAKAQMNDIVAAPFPGPPFFRRLFLVARHGEFDSLAKRLAIVAREVLSRTVIDELSTRIPWLRGQITVRGPTDAS